MKDPEITLRKPTREELRECANEVRKRVEVRPIDETWQHYFGAAELARALINRGLNPVGTEIYLPLLAQLINITDAEGKPLVRGKYRIGAPMIHTNGLWDERIPVKRVAGNYATEQIINGRMTIFTLNPRVKWNNPSAIRDLYNKKSP